MSFTYNYKIQTLVRSITLSCSSLISSRRQLLTKDEKTLVKTRKSNPAWINLLGQVGNSLLELAERKVQATYRGSDWRGASLHTTFHLPLLASDRDARLQILATMLYFAQDVPIPALTPFQEVRVSWNALSNHMSSAKMQQHIVDEIGAPNLQAFLTRSNRWLYEHAGEVGGKFVWCFPRACHDTRSPGKTLTNEQHLHHNLTNDIRESHVCPVERTESPLPVFLETHLEVKDTIESETTRDLVRSLLHQTKETLVSTLPLILPNANLMKSRSITKMLLP